jgi:sporulation protein YlmC with PRC-barrel domain
MNVRKVNLYAMSSALALALVLVPQAVAQQSQPAKAPEKTAAAKTTPASPVAGVIPLGVTKIEADLIAPGMRASKLMKQRVYNESGQKIGEIEDLVIAPDGTLSAAVVEVGGFLGIAKHKVAIPVKQFTAIHPKVVLPGATKDALKSLPEFIPA